MNRQIGKALLSRTADAMMGFAQTGERPKDRLHAAYIDLAQATGKLMDASVGGEGYGPALAGYEQRHKAFREALGIYGLS